MGNIVLTLSDGLDEIVNNYDRKVKKNVRKATELGLSIKIEDSMVGLQDFIEVYYSTMKRRSADNAFFFESDFFNVIQNELKGNYIFFYVVLNGKVISTELVLKSNDKLYSFLGGTLEEYFEYRPNDFLKNEIIRWGNDRGYQYFILGGGHGEEDGIYRYKKSFSPNGRKDFYVGTRIINSEKYALLCMMNGCNPQDEFVPVYRRQK